MDINHLRAKIKLELAEITDEAETEIKIILNKLFQISGTDIFLNRNITISAQQLSALETYLAERKKYKPIQYIFKEQPFRNNVFYVDERVLIPRPETEILIDYVKEITYEYFSHKSSINIADIGCGSGSICLSLADEIDSAKVFATDISNDALDVTRINQKKLKISDEKIIYCLGDRFQAIENMDKFDIIVSNPPYISETDYHKLDKHVRLFEPQIALMDNEKDGLGFYRYFAQYSPKYLMTGGFLCFEIGFGQSKSVIDIISNYDYFTILNVIKDYDNIERFIILRLKK